ncbi:MAG: glycosyltransferase, partial [Campylobacterales bacterium]|nr:glycosyltransferase [Campylobacterales bacterium]
MDKNYSTTQLLTKEKPKIIHNPEDKFETVLFLPEGEGRKGEGGLRTRGLYKKSYENKPLVSIITVVYNGEKFLEDTIKSVINQSYDNVEYIIIDGGSTDGTVEIIKKYEAQIDYWVSEKDNGIYDAMNKGISLVTGDIIGLINADDWYEKNTVELIISVINENDKFDVVYGLIRYIKNEQELKIEAQNHHFLSDRMIPHPTCFIKSKVYKKLGNYVNDYKSASDYDLLVRVYKNNCIFHKIDKVLANFRIDGISSNDFTGAIETLKIKKKNKYITLQKYI